MTGPLGPGSIGDVRPSEDEINENDRETEKGVRLTAGLQAPDLNDRWPFQAVNMKITRDLARRRCT